MGDRRSPIVSDPNHRLVVAIQETVEQMKSDFNNNSCPISDDSRHLHRFCSKLEYVLQSDFRDNYSLLGSSRDYWDYICRCLSNSRALRNHDGIKFVKSVKEFKTSLGRGRAFIRFCLMHKCLADTLQQCVQNGRVTSEFYQDKSLLLNFESSSQLISCLYDLNEVEFDLCPHGYDLDVAWPTFARSFFESPSSWRAPSRTVSLTSLASMSNSSQQTSQLYRSGDEQDGRSVLDESKAEPGEAVSEVEDAEKSSPLKKADTTDGLNDAVEEKVSGRQYCRLCSRAEGECSRSLSADNASLRDQLDKWKELVAAYADKLAVKVRVNEHLEKQVGALKEGHEALREMMKLRTSECDSLRALVAELKSVERKPKESEADLKAENEDLVSRLELFRQWLSKVVTAEAELAEVEGREAEGREAAADSDAHLVVGLDKTVKRLSRLTAEKRDLQAELVSSQQMNSSLISKVEEQEEKLTTVTLELGEAKRLVASLRQAFESLETSEAVLRYELKEKRTVVDRLRQQLECSRAQWARIRQKHAESELEWLSLRADFAGRYKQDSEESGYVDKCCSESPPPLFSESAATSSGSDTPVPNSRLHQMEEQCQLLYSQLVASREKSESLEWKLSQIHERHGQQQPPPPPEEDVVELPVRDVNANFDVDRGRFPESPSSTDLSLEERAEAGEAIEERAEEEGFDVEDRGGLRSELELVRTALAEREAEVKALQSSRSELLRRDEEFRRRVGLVMKKERDERESRCRLALAANQQLKSSLDELGDRQRRLDEEERAVRRRNEELEATKCALEREVASLRFELSSEAMRSDEVAKSHARHEEDIAALKEKLSRQEQLIASLEEELSGIRHNREVEKEQQKLELHDLKLCLNTREEECASLIDELKELNRSLDEERQACRQMTSVADDLKRDCLRLNRELSQVQKDNVELQKKTVKLIKEKDLLWKQSERLSFQQKIQATDRWLRDSEASHCLACRAEFTLVLRKHHCRLCGRIFCHNCCNHWAMTTSSSRRVRVCNECLMRHSQIDSDLSVCLDGSDDECGGGGTDVDSTAAARPDHSPVSGAPSPTSASEVVSSDAAEDSSGVDGQLAQSAAILPSENAFSREVGTTSLLGRLFTNWSSSSTEVAESDDKYDEDFCVITDEEIMKSLSISSPYSVLSTDPCVHLCPVQTPQEILSEFECGLPREVWVNAGRTYAVPLLLIERTTLTWAFTTEPKSIAFMLGFNQSAAEAADCRNASRVFCSPHSQVLIDTTHCDSHVHPVHGKLVAKNPGIYTFYFDNTFSRFTAKKLKLILRVHEDDVVAEPLNLGAGH